MKRRAMLLIGAMALALVVAGGVAMALTQCTTNPCNGTPQDDAIRGSQNDDTINALAGNDSVVDPDGIDNISLGDGSDFVEAGLRNDTIFGGAGSDNKDGTAVGYAPPKKGLIGAEGSDSIFGGGGGDFIDLATLDSVGSVDFASGGRGNDTIHARDNKQDNINCGRGTRDHVYFDKGLDSVSRNCEKKHPNQVPSGYPQPS